jgi:hypothetical protein
MIVQPHDDADTYFFMAYNCPVTGNGHFSINESTAQLTRVENTDLVKLEWDCADCEGKHSVTMTADI